MNDLKLYKCFQADKRNLYYNDVIRINLSGERYGVGAPQRDRRTEKEEDFQHEKPRNSGGASLLKWQIARKIYLQTSQRNSK